MMMQSWRKLSGPRLFSTSLAEARPQFETQAAFNKYSRILWSSGECGPTSPKVAGSNPDFCNFSAKNGKFSEKIHPRTAPPTIAGPPQSRHDNATPSMESNAGG